MQNRKLRAPAVYTIITSRGVPKGMMIKGKMVSLLLMTCPTLIHSDGGDAAWMCSSGHEIHSPRDGLLQIYNHSYRCFVHSSSTEKGQEALLLLLSWSFPVFSAAHRKHPSLFYCAVLTIFHMGESSSTITFIWTASPIIPEKFWTHRKMIAWGFSKCWRFWFFKFCYWDRPCFFSM